MTGLVGAHGDLGIFSEEADPQLACLWSIRRAVEVGDEGPDLWVGKLVVMRVDWEIPPSDGSRHVVRCVARFN